MNFEELILEYQKFKIFNREKANEIILLMRQFVVLQNDEFLYARFAYYEAESFYYNGKLEDAYFLIQEHCLPVFKKKKFTIEIIYAHNLLGVILQRQYEYLNAIDEYMQGLDIAIENEEYRYCAIIYNNISKIFAEYDDYDSAIKYLLMSLKTCTYVNVDDHEKLIIYLNLGLTCCRTNDFKEAKKYLSLCQDIFKDEEHQKYLIFIKIIKCLIARNDEDYNTCYLELTSIIELGKKNFIETHNFKEVLFLVSYTCFFVGRNISEEIFELLKKKVTKMKNLDFEICLYEEMIHYYLKMNLYDKVNALTTHYYELSRARNDQSKKLMLESIDAKFKIYQLTKDNLQAKANMITLKVKAEMDSLTKLLNRSALDSVVDDWFNKAKKEQLPMAVGIIDVDFFKQFNDTYGHIQGDHSLRMLAEVMDRMQKENILFIRYGGDEFLAFYLNHSKDKVRSLAKLLKSEIRALNIEHSSSLLEEKNLSITQGIFYAIPRNNENIYDFIRKCDDSLYEGKIKRSSIIFNER